MAGGRDERVEDLFFEEVVGDPAEEGQMRRVVGDDIRVFLGGTARSIFDAVVDTDNFIATCVGDLVVTNAGELVTRN